MGDRGHWNKGLLKAHAKKTPLSNIYCFIKYKYYMVGNINPNAVCEALSSLDTASAVFINADALAGSILSKFIIDLKA